MDDLLNVLVLLFYWRVIVALGAAVFVAWVVSLVAPGTPEAVSFGMAFVGFVLGIVWQAAADTPPGRQASSPYVSTPVAALGIATCGGLLAGGCAAAFNSLLLGALVCIGSTFLAGIWYLWIRRIPVTRRNMVLTVAFLIGVACGLGVIASQLV
jgi:hypothetical protein